MRSFILLVVSFILIFVADGHGQNQVLNTDSTSLYKKKSRERKLVSHYGLFIGLGAGLTSFSEINSTLSALHIQTVDNILAGRLVGFSAGNDFVTLQFKYSKYNFYNPIRKDSVYTAYNSGMFEASIGSPVIRHKNIESTFLLGWNYSLSNLLFSSNFISSQPSFPALLSSPSTPYATILYRRTHSIATELKTIYKVEAFNPFYIDLGLHLGALFAIPQNLMDIAMNNVWVLQGSMVPVNNLASYRQNYFYINLSVAIVLRHEN